MARKRSAISRGKTPVPLAAGPRRAAFIVARIAGYDARLGTLGMREKARLLGESAFSFYRGMFGLASHADFAGFYRSEALLFVVAGWFIIFIFPNTQQIVAAYRPSVNWRQWRDVALPASARFIHWRPNAFGLACIGVLLAGAVTATIIEMSREPAQFIYFQF